MIPYINIHTHGIGGFPDTISLHSQRLGKEDTCSLPCSAGIHPWDVAEISDLDSSYSELKNNKNIRAVGEIGLDYLRPDKELQKTVFAEQLKIAEVLALPVIIHCVKAFEDVISELKKYTLKGVVFHSYTGSAEQTAILLRSNYYASLSKASLKSHRTIEGILKTKFDKLFVETDDDKISIQEMYAAVSEALDIPLPLLKEKIYGNYLTLFG